jgi:anti-sigma regulatory factor (Ser/Thr protein kinase)
MNVSSMIPLLTTGTINAVTEIQAYIDQVAQLAQLAEQTTFKLHLAVEEIVANIVFHGYKDQDLPGSIRVYAILESQRLVIILEDSGDQFDPHQSQPLTEKELQQNVEKRAVGGLGIFLALQNVDEFFYEWKNNLNVNSLIVYRS